MSIRTPLVDWLDDWYFRRNGRKVSPRYQPPAVRPGEPAPRAYQICSRCIMDTSDPEITFDDDGVCNHCHRYDQQIAAYVKRDAAGWAEMEMKAEQIKQEGRGKPYDCIIGLSGGVDSSYVAYLVVKRLGLRPLAVHMDNGWNTEIAVANIENIVSRLGIDLHTVVLDWEEFKDLQAAFVRAGVPDCEIPTDHAIAAVLYQCAAENGVRHIIGGSNLATEQMIPRTWSAGHGDWLYIRSIHKAYGRLPRLKRFPHFTLWDYAIWWPYWQRVRTTYVLNYLEYDKFAAIDLMKQELGWVSYGDKHHESIYTRFYQSQYLTQKFKADKRRPHLSCLINDHRLTRAQALEEIAKPTLDPNLAATDREFVLKKLGISEAEFEEVLVKPPKTYWDFDSYEKYFPDDLYQKLLERFSVLPRFHEW
jgi:N-acetyl sugar amidotransferase